MFFVPWVRVPILNLFFQEEKNAFSIVSNKKKNATDDILKEQLLYQIDFSIFMFPSLYEKKQS